MLVEHDLIVDFQVRVSGLAEAVGIATAQAVGAMIARIEADDVLSPQPHELIGLEVVPDGDWGRRHFEDSRWLGCIECEWHRGRIARIIE